MLNDKSPASMYVEKALSQVEKLNKLIADLLDSSRIEHGKLKINCKPFDIEKMIAGIIEMARENYEGYQFERVGTVTEKVTGDEIRLEQVLVNLISNAVKYSPENKHIRIETEVRGKILYVGVSDNGIGISDAEQKKLFRKFYRVEKSATQFQGLGIGLYICSEILSQHNAEIGVTSEQGKGSTFFFLLPINSTN
jgi:signal transduction histidine kinase